MANGDEGNGNGRIRVSLGWLQLLLTLVGMGVGWYVSYKILEVRAEFQHVELLKEVNRQNRSIDDLEERLRNIEFTLVKAGMDPRSPSIIITRRGQDKGDEPNE